MEYTDRKKTSTCKSATIFVIELYRISTTTSIIEYTTLMLISTHCIRRNKSTTNNNAYVNTRKVTFIPSPSFRFLSSQIPKQLHFCVVLSPAILYFQEKLDFKIMFRVLTEQSTHFYSIRQNWMKWITGNAQSQVQNALWNHTADTAPRWRWGTECFEVEINLE